ncbi:MAG: hypothetical protein AVDCRST_MAG73-699, partial [uncultured Thermomicrobiales bacterium]
ERSGGAARPGLKLPGRHRGRLARRRVVLGSAGQGRGRRLPVDGRAGAGQFVRADRDRDQGGAAAAGRGRAADRAQGRGLEHRRGRPVPDRGARGRGRRAGVERDAAERGGAAPGGARRGGRGAGLGDDPGPAAGPLRVERDHHDAGDDLGRDQPVGLAGQGSAQRPGCGAAANAVAGQSRAGAGHPGDGGPRRVDRRAGRSRRGGGAVRGDRARVPPLGAGTKPAGRPPRRDGRRAADGGRAAGERRAGGAGRRQRRPRGAGTVPGELEPGVRVGRVRPGLPGPAAAPGGDPGRVLLLVPAARRGSDVARPRRADAVRRGTGRVDAGLLRGRRGVGAGAVAAPAAKRRGRRVARSVAGPGIRGGGV